MTRPVFEMELLAGPEHIDELLAMADTAMARSKSNGDGGYRFFSHAMSRGSAIDIESALRQALQKNEFDLYFQPQISLATGRLVGMEALLRWSRPGRGLVPPDHFIPVAEEIGLIIDIGVWTLHRAAQQLKARKDAGLPLVPIAGVWWTIDDGGLVAAAAPAPSLPVKERPTSAATQEPQGAECR